MAQITPLTRLDISIHALREEGDQHLGFLVALPFQFLSTPSARRATLALHRFPAFLQFLSTPSARRATTRRDASPSRTSISIHALREEGDNITLDEIEQYSKFLSTPSVRRATEFPDRSGSQPRYFYPRPP